jgi:hypothetical protein
MTTVQIKQNDPSVSATDGLANLTPHFNAKDFHVAHTFSVCRNSPLHFFFKPAFGQRSGFIWPADFC